MTLTYEQLSFSDISEFIALMKLFGEVFEEMDTYQGVKPSESYIKTFLSDSEHIILVAQEGGSVIGGLVAYELKKFEQERSEIYIYDLSVSKVYQRKQVGTTLLKTLKNTVRKPAESLLF